MRLAICILEASANKTKTITSRTASETVGTQIYDKLIQRQTLGVFSHTVCKVIIPGKGLVCSIQKRLHVLCKADCRENQCQPPVPMQLIKIMSSRRKRTVATVKRKKQSLTQNGVKRKLDFTNKYCIDVFTHFIAP